MQVAGERGHQPGALAATPDVVLLEVREVAPRRRLDLVGLGVHPTRLGGDQHHLVLGPEVPPHRLEVLELLGVEVGVELDVDRPEPPLVRQPQREVAGRLAGPPAPDPAVSAAEHAQEAREPVVPVVVSRHCPYVRGRLGLAAVERCGERAEEVILVGLDRGGGVDLVSAQHEQLAPRQTVHVRLGKQPGHRARGVEAVAGVGEVVEPQLLAARAVVRGLDWGVERLALVGQPAERRGDPHLDGRGRQQLRVEPASHPLAHEADLLALFAPLRLGAGEAVAELDALAAHAMSAAA